MAETARCLSVRGHDVTVITSGRPGAVPSRPQEWHEVRLRRRFESDELHQRHFAAHVARILSGSRFDVVHSLMPRDAAAAVLTRRVAGHRVVYEEIGIPYRWYWASLTDGRVRAWLTRKADVFGCMSDYALRILRRDWDREGQLIPGGVRTAQFALPVARAGRPTVLFSAALDEARKGLPLLLKAVTLALPEVPDLQVWLSGPGDPGPALASAPAEVRQIVQVLPLGDPEALGGRYAEAWVTALPAISEAFGLVLVESLAAGTPIAVVDDGGPPSLVGEGTGAIAPPNDPGALRDALLATLRLARMPGTRAACRQAARAYDWDEAIAPRLERLYEQAVTGAPGGR